jgi:uncharacterized protein (TIGR02246 family)
MKRLTHGSFIVIVGLLAACAQAPPKPGTDTLVDAANKLDQAFVDAFNRGDADGLAALYWNHPDVVSFPADILQARGVTAIREANAASFAALKGAKLQITESHQMAAGDVVIGWGLYRLVVPLADRKSREIIGRYTDVKAERDGKWVYLMDHASVPLGPAPAK